MTTQPTPHGIPALLRKVSRRTADPMARRCPYCQAAPGEPCVNTAWGGVMDHPHGMRAEG